MVKCIGEIWSRGATTTVISTGPMTNIALFISVYPDLLCAVEEFIFMGGGVGLGNRSAVAGVPDASCETPN
jgi:uridine nucleosidase